MRLAITSFVFLAACAGGHPLQSGDDAAGPDAPIDPTGDGGVDAPPAPVTCGGSVCRADQTCSTGVCTFGCVGSHVPGDYATIQGAIDALAATGTDSTICLAATQYAESTIYVRDSASHHKALKIIGESMARTTINAEVHVQAGWASVLIQGVHISVPNTRTALYSQGPDLTVKLVGTKLSGLTGIDAYQRQDLSLDGCEIAADGGYGLSMFANVSGPLTARVENSYFHGGYAVKSSTNGYAIDLALINNTVKDAEVGVDLSGATTAVVANNIFTGATSYAMQWLAPAMITRENNALWNNVTNYGGLASDGAGYLKTDCLLETSGRVPTLRAGSPCLAAGDGAVGSTHDFYGAPRGASPDLGAVEAP